MKALGRYRTPNWHNIAINKLPGEDVLFAWDLQEIFEENCPDIGPMDFSKALMGNLVDESLASVV